MLKAEEENEMATTVPRARAKKEIGQRRGVNCGEHGGKELLLFIKVDISVEIND